MVKQYMAIKENHKDAILFYRMGDFYEMFFEDAVTASKILEITLTSRNKNNDVPIPMCGIPVKAIDSYLGRLINRGMKVAICEQVEDPAIAKGIVKREVVRIVTPGMIIDNELLDAKSSNYILTLAIDNKLIGLSFLDISTGVFKLTQSESLDLIIDEALRIGPKEILLPEKFQDDKVLVELKKAFSETSISFIDDSCFAIKQARDILLDHFRTRSLEGFGCENMTGGICAAGALFSYVRETQKQRTEHLCSIETYSLGNYLSIDGMSIRNLELMRNLRTGSSKGTFLSIIDQTITAMGGRLLMEWIKYPLLNKTRIQDRLEAVAELKTNVDVREDLRRHLKSVGDMERLLSKITLGRANARDMIALKNSLKKLPDIVLCLEEIKTNILVPDGVNTSRIVEELQDIADLVERSIKDNPPPTINDGGIIKTGYDIELDELIKITREGKDYLARLEAEERKKTGINSLKVKYNKVFGYYIEVSKTHMDSVPPHYVRKQTLVNAERYITDELKNFESKVLGAMDKMAELEYAIFSDIKNKITEKSRLILEASSFISRLDCITGLAHLAQLNDYCKPEFNEDGSIVIEDGRHPVVEKMITGERYVPNSIRLDNEENQVLIITGPNMAGKSTVLRQVALMALMAQMGSFVPARSASVCVIKRIFTRVGALDNLSSGQSTFMVEMEETANIMNNAGPDSLVIMDEIGRGTSTFDGLSIAWAVAEFLHDLENKGVKTLFATHYHELTELAKLKPRVKNYNIAVKEWNDEIIFLRKLAEGSTNRSYGIQVARLAGIPSKIIKRAKKVLTRVENGDHILGKSGFKNADKNQGVQQVQLSLFRKPEEILMEKLHGIDISKMTPLEAINYLSVLKQISEKAVI